MLLLVDSKINALLHNIYAHHRVDILNHVDTLKHVIFRLHLHHHVIYLANNHHLQDSKMHAHHNLDFKIKLFHNVDSHSNKIGDALQTSNWDSQILVQHLSKMISVNLLHHKILAISLNLEDKVILDVLKDKTHVVVHNLNNLVKDLEILEFLRKIRNRILVLLKVILLLLCFEKLKKKWISQTWFQI